MHDLLAPRQYGMQRGVIEEKQVMKLQTGSIKGSRRKEGERSFWFILPGTHFLQSGSMSHMFSNKLIHGLIHY